jgi:lysophospholipase L1-like esterase
MWFRIFLGSFSLAFSVLLIWLAHHQSGDGAIFGRYSGRYFLFLLGVGSLVLLSGISQINCVYQHIFRFRKELILLLASVGISVGATEFIIRLVDPLGISYFQDSSRYHLDKLADSSRVFKHRPELDETYQKVKVRTNEHGFRDRPLREKQKDELRILLLGDSVTFGVGVRAEDTFGRKLESVLRSNLNRPVRTVNTGVGGYNTVQEYATLTSFAEVIDPDMVFLLYVMNDIEINDPPFNPWSHKELKGKSPPEILNILLKKSWIYRLGFFVSSYAFTSDSSEIPSLDKDWRGIKESRDSLAKIANFCQARKIPFVTFFYRPKNVSSIKPSIGDQLFQEILSVGNKHQFPVVDIEPWWGSRNMRSMTNSVVDSHPNRLGHEVLAIGMADFLGKFGKYGIDLKMRN